MLEIQVSLRCGCAETTVGACEKTHKKAGDIIVAQISPGTWGTMDRRVSLLTYLDDAALEATMSAGECRGHPYALYEDIYDEDREENVWSFVGRSTWVVDLDMFTGSDGIDPQETIAGPVEPNAKSYLELSDMTDVTETLDRENAIPME